MRTAQVTLKIELFGDEQISPEVSDSTVECLRFYADTSNDPSEALCAVFADAVAELERVRVKGKYGVARESHNSIDGDLPLFFDSHEEMEEFAEWRRMRAKNTSE